MSGLYQIDKYMKMSAIDDINKYSPIYLNKFYNNILQSTDNNSLKNKFVLGIEKSLVSNNLAVVSVSSEEESQLYKMASSIKPIQTTEYGDFSNRLPCRIMNKQKKDFISKFAFPDTFTTPDNVTCKVDVINTVAGDYEFFCDIYLKCHKQSEN
jgi:hypothetical protein